MQPTKELIDELFLDKVRQARNTDPAERFLDGPRLFDYACGIVKWGIRNQFPDASEEEVHRILCERVELNRRLEKLP